MNGTAMSCTERQLAFKREFEALIKKHLSAFPGEDGPEDMRSIVEDSIQAYPKEGDDD